MFQVPIQGIGVEQEADRYQTQQKGGDQRTQILPVSAERKQILETSSHTGDSQCQTGNGCWNFPDFLMDECQHVITPMIVILFDGLDYNDGVSFGKSN